MSQPGASEAVSVQLLDREYTVGVLPSERDSLLAAAQVLDAQMREVRGGNKMAAIDRVAVLAALNIAHELQQLRDAQAAHDRDLVQVVEELRRKVDRLIDP